MQHHKFTTKNAELEIISSDSEKLTSSLPDVMKKFEVKKRTSIFDFIKYKGIAISSLINILLVLPFYEVANIWQLMR